MLKLSIASSIAVAAALLQSSAGFAGTIPTTFSASNFSDPLTINNIYFPFIAGTTHVSKSDIGGGTCEVDVTTVTYDTRVIDGVTTRVVHDSVYDSANCNTAPAALTEDTKDYYAQDNSGNVWYMGEDTFTCQGAGSCTPSAGAWLAGVNAAQPGFIMLATPHSGDRYRQEYLQGVAEDQAVVDAVGVTAKMTRGDAYRASYSNCVVTKEFSVLEKGAIEYKTYCPNIGVVQTVEHRGKVIYSELTSISGTANALKFRSPPKH